MTIYRGHPQITPSGDLITSLDTLSACLLDDRPAPVAQTSKPVDEVPLAPDSTEASEIEDSDGLPSKVSAPNSKSRKRTATQVKEIADRRTMSYGTMEQHPDHLSPTRAYRNVDWIGSQNITRNTLVENGYREGVLPWYYPSSVGWNPLIQDFGIGTARYSDRLDGQDLDNVAIAGDEIKVWLKSKTGFGDENYRKAQNMTLTQTAPSVSTIFQTKPATDSQDGYHYVYSQKGIACEKDTQERYYHIKQTYVTMCAQEIYKRARSVRPGDDLFAYYIGGAPGGGKTAFGQQLAAHMGMPLVKLSMRTDQPIDETIFYTPILTESGTDAVLSDVAYAYVSGGLLQIDDIQGQQGVGFLSTLLDPSVSEIQLQEATSQSLNGKYLFRHPGFTVLITHNDIHHMAQSGHGTEIPTNVTSRCIQLSNDWDNYESIIKSSEQWVHSHPDPWVQAYGLISTNLMSIIRDGPADGSHFLASTPSVRELNKILSQGTLLRTIGGMTLILNTPEGQASWYKAVRTYLEDYIRTDGMKIFETLRKTGLGEFKEGTKANIIQANADDLVTAFAEIWHYISEVYGEAPAIASSALMEKKDLGKDYRKKHLADYKTRQAKLKSPK